MTTHILYSYRRCPYAMRARMALKWANAPIEVREITLREKPTEMLAASPKGTVPVLVLASGEVIEQSLEIMHWALKQCQDQEWYPVTCASEIDNLIARNDGEFKFALDRYKYPERFPDRPQTDYREAGLQVLADLDNRLSQLPYLVAKHPTLADYAIFPFVRQFAKVDPEWFAQAGPKQVNQWLTTLLNSPLFNEVMQKYPVWTPMTTPHRL